MRCHQAPNVIILSRAGRAPIPQLSGDELPEDAFDAKKEDGDLLQSAVLGRKAELRGMSVKSSLNVSRLLSSLDWGKNGRCLHVSLSYGRHHYRRGKSELALEKQALVMALYREGFCGLWILEFQSRENDAEKAARIAARIKRQRGQGGSIKVPHWHLLLWVGDRDLEDVERWLRSWWARFAKNPSEHGVYIASGDQGRSRWYLALHAAKRAQPPPFPVGRMWGYIDRERVLAAQDLHETGQVLERERVWWARLYRRATGGRTRCAHGLSWFLPRAWQCVAAAWIRDHVDAENATRWAGKPPF